ncbi:MULTISPECIES: nuclease domain-containing protein [unclassified Paraburkholderia]|uniref:nuclease domain-containing protein n=1 Tax=unclassified Paraburkholderia TaxID=2615204 RepID=UPI002AB2DC14|nr:MULTISPECIES: nuclease domain-containing protein [unclassified Paraburkholderia]
MKRTGFKRKPDCPFNSLSSRTPIARSAPMKRRTRKPTIAEGSRYLDACRGEQCYLRVAGVCSHCSESVVPCHSNQARHGKGMGIKAAHEFTVPGCQACHAWIDQGAAPREAKFGVWDSAFERWAPVRAAKLAALESAT